MTTEVSTSPTSATAGSASAEPATWTSTGSRPVIQRNRSKKCTVWSRIWPPDAARYDSGGRLGPRLVIWTSSTVPISPARTASCTARWSGSKRRLKSTIAVTPDARTAATASAAISRDRSIGFSQNTALPDVAQACSSEACVSEVDAMRTASICGSANTRSMSVTAWAPVLAASASARAASGSATVRSSTSGWFISEVACTEPMNPAPTRANRCTGVSLPLRDVER